MEKTAHGFKVISKTNQAEGIERISADRGVQQSLFQLRSSRSAIFVSLPDVDHTEFVSVLKNSAPAIIVELRRIPRFDFGPPQSKFNLRPFPRTRGHLPRFWKPIGGIRPARYGFQN